jgi:CelD/BcsL family acetyltransferase involved in cellulose biosynthesis
MLLGQLFVKKLSEWRNFAHTGHTALDQSFKWLSSAGLPDGLFQNQKSQFG